MSVAPRLDHAAIADALPDSSKQVSVVAKFECGTDEMEIPLIEMVQQHSEPFGLAQIDIFD